MIRHVSISEMKIANKSDDVLATYSLGSCIGLSLYDPELRLGGMIHCMLPASKVDVAKARVSPAMFVDTGVPALLQAMFNRGAKRKRLIAKVAGAAAPLDGKGYFKIGEHNFTVMRKILWKNDVLISAEDVGGNIARSMYLYIGNGMTVIRSKGIKRQL
jgi:chemotaxis protein CheD